MTPQERDLITALFDRLKQQAGTQKDAEAESLIRQGMMQQPDAAYLLVQTVLIQDMALHEAQNRMAEYQRQLAACGQVAPAPQPSSFLPGRQGPGQGAQTNTHQGQEYSVAAAGPWGARPAEPAAAPAPARPVWTQAAAPAQAPQYAPPPPAYGVPPAYGSGYGGGGYGPQMLAGGGGGFLRQAAATAAGVVGGSLLFEGISSMFGPHYGSGFMGSMPMQQPGLSETVINNYYNDPNNPQADPGTTNDAGSSNDAGYNNDPGQQGLPDDQGVTQADYQDNSQDPGQDFGQDQGQDFDPGQDPGQDFGGDDNGGSFGV